MNTAVHSSAWVLPLADPQATLETVGGKGASLARLVAAGLPVPDGFHVTTAAYRRFVTQNNLQPGIAAALETVDVSQPAALEAASQAIRARFAEAQTPPDVAGAIALAYASLAGRDPVVAVRSSATAEDLPEASFAGQQDTFLNIKGYGALLDAIKRCWASLWTARAIGYRERQNIAPEGLSLAVIVQLLVPAEAAGILFTANPITGHRDQALISAAWGLGEAVVGGLVTPDALTVDKRTGTVLECAVADKQVMTVRVNGGTEEQPVPRALRQAPVLDDESAAELVELGIRVEDLYAMPMDIEWAFADGAFALVQARPITALPEPEAAPPTDWPMPNPKGRYMRASIIDLLPDPLSPLFASLGVGTLNRGIGTMSNHLLNMPEGSFPNFMRTINGYAYQEVSFSGKEWWFILTRLLPAVPRLLREGVAYWQDIAHPQYAETATLWRERPLAELPAAELLAGVHELAQAFAHHIGALMASTMGPSAGSEALFTRVYEKLVKREGDPEAPTFLMGYGSIPIQGEKALYDLALWTRERDALAAYLTAAPTDQLVIQTERHGAPPGVPDDDWHEWQFRFQEYLDRYGYSIYDLDFAKPLPRDNPAPLLEMFKLFVDDEAKNPYERQQAYADRREQAVESTRARLKGLRSWAFEKTLKWAQSQAPLREDGIAEIGRGYPELRRLLRELGRRFSIAGAIARAEDIFWLEQAEVEAMVEMLEQSGSLENMMPAVQERKQIWRARKRVTPPPQLPPGKKYLGFDMEALLAGGEGELEGRLIKGVGACPGQVTATARVLHGPEDFSQMQPGDILVAAITTPAWTPLFAMAAGVVTDVGGPLSHGSIVAREYGIPAVMGTGVATRRITSGQRITVDGQAGTITLA